MLAKYGQKYGAPTEILMYTGTAINLASTRAKWFQQAHCLPVFKGYLGAYRY